MAKFRPLVDIARNPKAWGMSPMQLRQTGKSSMTMYMMEAVCSLRLGHAQRMRGRYVHAHKGRSLRPHARRRSWIDNQ